MICNTLSRLSLPVFTTAILLMAASPVMAQRGGGGGFHAGGYRVGSGSYGGYNYGYRPYYRAYRVYPSYGYWAYPYDVTGNSPYNDSSSYYTPSSSDGTNDQGVSMPTLPDTIPANIISTSVPTNPTSSRANSSGVAVTSGTMTAGTARISVRVPELSEVWIDGKMLMVTCSLREFSTPAVGTGQKYTVNVRVRWLEGYTLKDQTRTITVVPGEKIEVSFSNLGDSQKAKFPSFP
jgi:uncharacterized protein (TIGR03000 family)